MEMDASNNRASQKLTLGGGSPSVVFVDDYQIGINSRSRPSIGAVYLFNRIGSWESASWSQLQKLVADVSSSSSSSSSSTPTTGADGDQFGHSVSLDGDYLAVGAPGDDTRGANSGAVYIFSNSSSGQWMQIQKLTMSEGYCGLNCPSHQDYSHRQFGFSVSISGSTLVVGEHWIAENGHGPECTTAGAVFVFKKLSSNTFFIRDQVLTASDGATGHRFGSSVSISGNTVLVGAPQDDKRGGPRAGAAYVFHRTSATGAFTQQQKLMATNGKASREFGRAVSLQGDTAAVSSHERYLGPKTMRKVVQTVSALASF